MEGHSVISPTRVILIRHAHTDVTGVVLSGRLPGVALTPQGRAEAAALPARVTDYAPTLDALYVSPLERTMETAAALARAFSLVPRQCDGINEMDFGRWTGRHFTDLDEEPDWHTFNTCRREAVVPGGETAPQLQARVLTTLAAIVDAHRGGSVAVVTHAEVVRVAALHYAGLSLDDYWRFAIAPASITVVRFADNPELLVVDDREWTIKSVATSSSTGAQAPGAG